MGEYKDLKTGAIVNIPGEKFAYQVVCKCGFSGIGRAQNDRYPFLFSKDRNQLIPSGFGTDLH